MHYEVTPEPTEEERRAIERALAAAGEPAPYSSAWRRAGADPDEDDAPAATAGSGRASGRGAT